jgi:hypothetical protein
VLQLEAITKREEMLLQKITPARVGISKQQAGRKGHATELGWWRNLTDKKAPAWKAEAKGRGMSEKGQPNTTDS